MEPSPVSTQKPYLIIQPGTGWAALNLQELWHFRDLLWTLAGRDIRLRYRQTALGVVWVVLQPLLAAGIFAFVFGNVARLPSNGIPYFLFSYAGLLGWSAFSSTLTKASTCLIGNAQLVSKVYFPRIVLPLSMVGSTLLDFAVALVLMGLLLAGSHVVPAAGILLLPLWLLLLLLFAVGAGLFFSALTVSYRDVQYVLPVLSQLLLYASPVAYGVSAVPERLRPVYFLNPLTGLLEAFRWSLLGQGQLHWGAVGYAALLALLTLIGGALTFKKMERRFADVI